MNVIGTPGQGCAALLYTVHFTRESPNAGWQLVTLRETWATHAKGSQVRGDHSVDNLLRFGDVGAVHNAVGGVGGACTGVEPKEGVAPQQRPYYLTRGKT